MNSKNSKWQKRMGKGKMVPDNLGVSLNRDLQFDPDEEELKQNYVVSINVFSSLSYLMLMHTLHKFMSFSPVLSARSPVLHLHP